MGVFFESILIGVLSGFVVVLFRLALEFADSRRETIYRTLLSGPVLNILLWIALVSAVGIFLGWMSNLRPMIRGSGIPQLKGALLRKMNLDWLPELPMKILGGVLSIGFGLSLGREGPSVQVGAYIGKGVLGLARRPIVERKYLITSGAAAGLSAAFNAPLAGVLFVLEELHRHFSPLLLSCAMGASVAGDLVASHFFGLKPAFDFHQIIPLSTDKLPWVVLMGIICAFGGEAFKRVLYGAQDLYKAMHIPPLFRPVIALLVSVPLGFFLFDATGGGHALIEKLWMHRQTFGLLLLLLVVKMLFSALSYGTGAAGGIFLPLLACGALTGKLYGMTLASLGIVNYAANHNFIILGMAGFFTSVVRAPITGAVLILEMSGNFNHFAGLVACCLSAFVFGYVLKSQPVYDVLLERMLERNPGAFKPMHGRKVVLEIPVQEGSALSNKFIRNIEWPPNCLIVGIERGEKDLLPKSDMEIRPGDLLTILACEEEAAEIKNYCLSLGMSKAKDEWTPS